MREELGVLATFGSDAFPHVACRMRALAGLFASERGGVVLLLVDRFAELPQVGVQGAQEPKEGMPADAAMSVLDLRDIGRADLHLPRQLLLGELGLFA